LFGASVLAGLGGLTSFLALVAAGALRGPRLRPASVEIHDGDLHVLDAAGAARVVPLAEVTQGFWEEPDLVHLALRRGDVLVVKVEGAAEGDRLLRAAGVSAAERALRVPLASAASQIPLGSIFGGVLLGLLGSGLFVACVALALVVRDYMDLYATAQIIGPSVALTIVGLLGSAVYAVLSALRRREVVVGTDGIAYRRSLSTEFIPYGQIARVLPDTRGVRVERKDGRRVLLPTRRAADRPLPMGRAAEAPRTPAEAQQRVLLERVREAMAAGAPSELAHVALDRLDRNGRPVAEWRGELVSLLKPEGDYRAARISPEDLGGVIEDPAAPAERRVAAALALSAREQAEARRRVRIAVQACADEELQRALEMAAEGEVDEALLSRAVRRREVR
ncbi:MAG: PH domain-containing protein, partial [Polyangiaceae bacterium]|nr:PH domain-containing protein [Polyangiaceae bacterium]